MENLSKAFRIPAVPLITCDPYFSVWSFADHLYDGDTRHWTGHRKAMRGFLQVDDRTYRFMGSGDGETAKQKSVEVTPVSSVYTFEAGGMELVVKFITPLLLNDLELTSRPCTYASISLRSVDGRTHQASLLWEVDAELCYHTDEDETTGMQDNPGSGCGKELSKEPAVCGGMHYMKGFEAAWMGRARQGILCHSGDDITIDWGYAYLAVPDQEGSRVFYTHDGNPEMEPAGTGTSRPAIAASLSFGEVGREKADRLITMAYDDVASIMYFGHPLRGYWAKDGKSILEALEDSICSFDDIVLKCDALDRDLMSAAGKTGGEEYASIVSLAYRQSIAAHKLVAGPEGEILFLSKECFSNGCIGTVDVSYPSVPLFLLYNTELVKGMLRPIFHFAEMPIWEYDFAPHDVGRYPYANGQVYGLSDTAGKDGGKQWRAGNGEVYPPYWMHPGESGIYSLKQQMPVEECANMLIMTAAVAVVDGEAAFAEEHSDLLQKWVQYLVKYGQDPGEQLCTDDFAGHLAHNVNLSAKAIMGVASWSILCRMMGRKEEAEQFMQCAGEMARTWETFAVEGDHTLLAFDRKDSWSMKYNLVWDILFGTELFDKDMMENEIQWYRKKQNRYGLPLDSRMSDSKTDWTLWCAAMADSEEDLKELIRPVYLFLQESRSRVPFSDWYDTESGDARNFRNRTVQGGLFMPLLRQSGKCSID